MEDKVYVLQTYSHRNEESAVQVFRSLPAAQEEMIADIYAILRIMVDDAYFHYVQTKIYNLSAEIYNTADDESEHKWWIEETVIRN